jgi:hypothetical protein
LSIIADKTSAPWAEDSNNGSFTMVLMLLFFILFEASTCFPWKEQAEHKKSHFDGLYNKIYAYINRCVGNDARRNTNCANTRFLLE